MFDSFNTVCLQVNISHLILFAYKFLSSGKAIVDHAFLPCIGHREGQTETRETGQGVPRTLVHTKFTKIQKRLRSIT